MSTKSANYHHHRDRAKLAQRSPSQRRTSFSLICAHAERRAASGGGHAVVDGVRVFERPQAVYRVSRVGEEVSSVQLACVTRNYKGKAPIPHPIVLNLRYSLLLNASFDHVGTSKRRPRYDVCR